MVYLFHHAQVLLGMAVLLCPVRGCPSKAECSFSSSGVCIAGWVLYDRTGRTSQSCYDKLSEADCRGQLCRAESTCCPSSTITATITTTTVGTTSMRTSTITLTTTSTASTTSSSSSSSSSSSFSTPVSTSSSDACNVVECSTYCTGECRWSAASSQCVWRKNNRNNQKHENGLGNCTLQPTPEPSTGSNNTLASVERVAKRGHVAAIVLLSIALILTWLLVCLRPYGYLGCCLKGGRHFNAMKNDVSNIVYDGASDTNHSGTVTLHETTQYSHSYSCRIEDH